MTATRRAAWAVAALTVLGAAVRFSTLDVQSFWVDEAATIHLLHRSFGGMLSAIPDSESTPPLYYVLAWLWTKLFGTGEVGLRSLSALAGTATVPVAYLAARRLVTERAGLVTAALVAVNPLLVWYSQEARAYALLALLAAATLAALPPALERPSRRSLGAWAVLAALALVTHYFALFVLVPEAIILLRRLRGRAVPAVAAAAVAGIALLPLVTHQAGNDRADFIREVGLAKRIVQVPKQYLVGFDAPLEALATVAAVAVALYGLWLLARRSDARERRGAGVAAFVTAGALGIPLVLSLVGIDYLITRNLIGGWFPAMIVVAAGLGVRAAPRAGAIATGCLCAVMLAVVVAVEANPAYQRSDWRGAASTLGPSPAPFGRALLVTPPSGSDALGIYLPRLSPIGPRPVAVKEIDVVATAARTSGQTPRPPRPVHPAPPPFGFVLAGTKLADTYTLVRYRSVTPAGALIDIPTMGSLQFTPGGADFDFQPPSR